ncbi:hypothetical protein AVBRAN12642_02940 [Campylobacter sp. RM12642]|uniref:hypothetical protein n=1 Tax=Campylobacter sp. RM12642 TaxID=2735736 RepID=UPI00301529B9|nr:hypothetical protein [Campylobacter sp. RM12642]
MNEELNITRSYFYEFCARAISFMNNDDFNTLREQAKFFYDNLDDLKDDFKVILDTDYAAYKDEQNAVFYDFSYVNVPTDASFYDEGRDNGKMRIIATGILKRANLIKNTNLSDNEDSMNFLFYLGSVLCKNNDELCQELFSRIINEVVDEFCEKLQTHKNSKIFTHIANIISYLTQIERAFYSVNAPAKKESVADKALQRIPYEPRLPTEFSKINMSELTSFKENIE